MSEYRLTDEQVAECLKNPGWNNSVMRSLAAEVIESRTRAPMPAPVRALRDMHMREDFDGDVINTFLKWATAEWPEEGR